LEISPNKTRNIGARVPTLAFGFNHARTATDTFERN
jgi:hypothetical protein